MKSVTMAAIGNVLLNMLLPSMLPWSIVPVFVYVLGMSIATPSLTLLGLDFFPAQRGLAASCQGFIGLSANSAVSAFVALIWPPLFCRAVQGDQKEYLLWHT